MDNRKLRSGEGCDIFSSVPSPTKHTNLEEYQYPRTDSGRKSAREPPFLEVGKIQGNYM